MKHRVFEILTINWQIFRQLLYLLFLKRISQVFKSIIDFINIDFSTLRKKNRRNLVLCQKEKNDYPYPSAHTIRR